jgi:hypothetical protein
VQSHTISEEYRRLAVCGKTELTENWLAMTGDGSHRPGMICHCLNSPLNPLDILPLLRRYIITSNQYKKKEKAYFFPKIATKCHLNGMQD